MPPNTGVPTPCRASSRSARCDHQRIKTENERERRHHHRAEAQTCAFGRRFQQRHALLALLLGEFDDQNAVLGRQPDQHDHADLAIEIERQPAMTIAANDPRMPIVTDSRTGTGMVQLS